MKSNNVHIIDLLIILVFAGIISAFALSDGLLESYQAFNREHGLITSFIKFGILATFGEVLGQRIRMKNYKLNQFGVLPKVIIWGFIGITIKLVFVIFANGTPMFIEYLGFEGASDVMKSNLSVFKLITALCISAAMNIIYAPLMMTFHKISDLHIAEHHGKVISIVKPIKIAHQLKKINWDVQWNFVFKKTIPIFWIPAHTITFLLPADYQVLFAAILSVALGTILAVATLKNKL